MSASRRADPRRTVVLRELEFAQTLQRLTAAREPARAALAKVPPVVVVGAALAGGVVLGRAIGFKRLFAPATILAGAAEDFLIKALLGGVRRLWNLNARDVAPEHDERAAAQDPD